MPMGTGGLGTGMDNAFMQVDNFLSIGVVLVCFVVGYLIKHYTKITNNYIPLIMIALGIIVNTLLSLPTPDGYGGVTVSTIFVGAVSGLASTGLYEMLAKSLGLKKNKEGEDPDSDSNESDNTFG